MKKIILLAETGSDVNAELAKEYGVEIVPMHVSFDTETLDDGAFPVEKIVEKIPALTGGFSGDCNSSLDLGTVGLLLSAVATAVVLKKRK